MNKKAFTLVELLAVIFLIGLISSIIVPNIMDTLKQKKEDLYNTNIKEIEKVASQYVVSHPDIITEDSFEIKLETLCAQYLDCPIYDHRNGEEISGKVIVTRDNNIFVYEFINDNE